LRLPVIRLRTPNPTTKLDPPDAKPNISDGLKRSEAIPI